MLTNFYKENDIVKVILPIFTHNNNIYSYKVPCSEVYKSGDFIEVKVLNKKYVGIIFEKDKNPSVKEDKIKFIISKLNISVDTKHLEFINWVASYNLAAVGMIFKMLFPFKDSDFLANKLEKSFVINAEVGEKLNPKQEEILKYFAKNKQMFLEDSKNYSQSSLKTLLKNDILKEEQVEVISKSHQSNIVLEKIELSKSQKSSVDKLKDIISENKFSVSFLDGVPGSGKTEVYFEVLNEVIKKGQEVLILLPEIGLSSQWTERFKKRFNADSYIWHSSINKGKKEETYKHILEGKVKILVGTRSALFLPFKNLGLIIVDEEHDSSFKQEDIVSYNARDMAIIKAKIFNLPVILTSATPSIETYYNIKNNKYNYVALENRFNNLSLPEIEVVDMSKEKLPKDTNLSQYLIESLKSNLENKKQSLLFINRRGYSTLRICKKCGERVSCPNCSSYLVEHKRTNSLICHYCGYKVNIFNNCLSCKEEDSLISYGAAIEKIAEEVQNLFKEAKLAIVSSDILNSFEKTKKLIEDFTNNKIDILVGTQMITKGYHFPKLTLVGIIEDNLGAGSLDLKSQEKAWQIFYQVSGRAGREEEKSKVIIQSYNKDNYLLKTLVNFERDSFLNKELENRIEAKMPPINKLASMLISSVNEEKLKEFVFYLEKNIEQIEGIDILGPIPCLIYKLNKSYRIKILFNADKNINIQKYILRILSKLRIPANIKIKIDIDPINFL